MNPLMEILASGVFAPKPKPRQWCSVSGLKFHLEKPASQARGLNWFEALCGVTGDFMHERFDGQTFLQCADCVQISSANILDVADQGRSTTELTESITVGNEGGESPAMISPLEISRSECPHVEALNTEKTGVQSTATDCTPETPFIRAIDHFTFHFLRFVDERLSAHALESVAVKLPDLPLVEQYKLEDLDAERESLGVWQ